MSAVHVAAASAAVVVVVVVAALFGLVRDAVVNH